MFYTIRERIINALCVLFYMIEGVDSYAHNGRISSRFPVLANRLERFLVDLACEYTTDDLFVENMIMPVWLYAMPRNYIVKHIEKNHLY